MLMVLATLGVAAVVWRFGCAQDNRYDALLREPFPRRLVVPVSGVRRRDLRDTWGAARAGGRKHEGIDIFAKKGTPIVSATHGIVARVGTDQLGGKIVTVYGPSGAGHYYAHLDRYGRYNPGDNIKAGDTIGFVGNTGNARTTPPHLHYGIYRRDSGAVNPYPHLKR